MALEPCAVEAIAALVAILLGGCAGCDPTPPCGPSSGVVASVVDGDTIKLESGETIRYLMVDTPEIPDDCYGPEATDFNRDLVLGNEVELEYDVECEDRFNRTLAYVYINDREVNSLLVERGFACVLSIPPNGQDREAEFEALEETAMTEGRGMWGACVEVTCTN